MLLHSVLILLILAKHINLSAPTTALTCGRSRWNLSRQRVLPMPFRVILCAGNAEGKLRHSIISQLTSHLQFAVQRQCTESSTKSMNTFLALS